MEWKRDFDVEKRKGGRRRRRSECGESIMKLEMVKERKGRSDINNDISNDLRRLILCIHLFILYIHSFVHLFSTYQGRPLGLVRGPPCRGLAADGLPRLTLTAASSKHYGERKT